MKNRALALALVLVVAAVSSWTAACGEKLPDDAAAKVGDVYITIEQLEKSALWWAAQYGLSLDQYPDTYSQVQTFVLENLVVAQLAALEAQDLGVTVTDEEVATRVDSYLTAYDGDQAAFEQTLATVGFTLDEFKQVMRDDLLQEKVRTEVTKDVVVTDEEIASYYEENKATYDIRPSREVRHILVAPEASGTVGTAASSTGDAVTTTLNTGGVTEQDWAKALKTAQEVRRRLASGSSWSTLARLYSDDLATKDSGGDMGTVYKGRTLPEFEEAAFSLQLDEISEPVKTAYGYEIIQVLSITEGGQQSLDEVREDIESNLLPESQAKVWNEWVEEQKAAVGVIYREDLPEPSSSTTTTELASDTTTTAAAP